jgi:hypothetical protein
MVQSALWEDVHRIFWFLAKSVLERLEMQIALRIFDMFALVLASIPA